MARYSRALDAKPSKGPWTDERVAWITDSVCDIPQLLSEIERLSGKHNLVRLAYEMADGKHTELTGAEIAESFRAMLDDHWRQRAEMAEAEVTRLKAQNTRYAQQIANASSSMQELLDVAMGPVRARLDAVLRTTYASDDGAEYEHDHGPLEGNPSCPACWAHDVRKALGVEVGRG